MGDDSDDEADRDPSNLVTSPPSVFVTVVNTGRHDINGLLGIVVSYNMEHERYLVHMTRSQSTMSLKKHHLKRVGDFQRARVNTRWVNALFEKGSYGS
jgi:hypothetical protein